MENGVLVKIISKLLRVGASEKLEKILRTSSPSEIQLIFSKLDASQKSAFFNLLFHQKVVSQTIRDLSQEVLEEIFHNISLEVALDLIQKLQPDDAADLMGKLPQEQSQWFLDKLDPVKKTQILKLLTYGKNTAGGIMNPNFFTLSQDSTINKAIELLRTKTQLEMVFYLYVVDEGRHLMGIVSLRQLLMSQGTVLLKDIMDSNVISISVNQPQTEVAQLIKRFNFLAIPVVDENKKLLGVVTIDDVINVIQEEATQDLYRMSGVEKDERVFTPIRSSIKNRAPWLIINLATAVLAAQVVGFFEGTIQKVVMLAAFLPVVAGMGGNAATQTLTIIIRGIALGELTFKEMKKALIKEIWVGVANGVINGIIVAVIAYYWKGMPMLGFVLMLAMIGNLFVAGAAGVLVPLGMKALKIDPAIASTVIVTTFTDCFGFFFFLGLSTLLIKYLM